MLCLAGLYCTTVQPLQGGRGETDSFILLDMFIAIFKRVSSLLGKQVRIGIVCPSPAAACPLVIASNPALVNTPARQ